MAAKPAEEPPHGETLKYQTWVLKVLIHCEGCKKRVKKILQGIDGVYKTEVDSLQHKVTVTGNVDAETLIKRLSRSGRLVELWPEKPAEKKDNKKSGKSNKGGDINKEKENQKNGEPGADAGSNEGSKDGAGDGEDSEKEEHGDECEEGGGGGGGGGGEGGKKKKKKKKKKNNGENGGSASVPPKNGEISKVDASVASNLGTSMAAKDLVNPPIQHAYPYPHVYYSPPPAPPAYGLSYNTAYPISSASYYVGAPIMPMHAYATPYSRLPPPPPPSDPIKHYGADDDDEDEYGGGGYCSIM
ncbi:heavy metal-associated isoprenylated plant protein 36-like [Vigna umbellata]|uniref:heavy metal-associated isoprenylated plant protein 36-like n=1 Tax=Vigna umbellata TaxID=87088 RepID=UPI001F5F4C4A|nr:heavy metal-associated isoprenylated plant protein 36-like [Vigna umbellata]